MNQKRELEIEILKKEIEQQEMFLQTVEKEKFELKSENEALQTKNLDMEQDNMRLSLIIEYLYKHQPPIKILQETCTQANDVTQELKIEDLENVIKIKDKQIEQLKELEIVIVNKEKEAEEMRDLICNVSDQNYSLKNDKITLNKQIEQLNDEILQQIEKQEILQKQLINLQNKDDKSKQKSSNLISKFNNIKEQKELIEMKESQQIKDQQIQNKIEQIDELRTKTFMLEKTIRSLTSQLAKKEQQLTQKINQNEQLISMSQIQNMNVEVKDLKVQLEKKDEQVKKCYSIIEYLEKELENYKQNYNIFQQHNKTTEKIIKSIQIPYSTNSTTYSTQSKTLHLMTERKLPHLLDETNSTKQPPNYKKRNHSLYTNPLENYNILKNAAKYIKSLRGQSLQSQNE